MIDVVKGVRVDHPHAALVGMVPELATAALNPAFLDRVRNHPSLRLEFSNGTPSVWRFSSPSLLDALRSAPGGCMVGESLAALDPAQMRAIVATVTPRSMPFLWMPQRTPVAEEIFHLVAWASTSDGDARIGAVLRGARGHVAYKATSRSPATPDEMWCHHVPLFRNPCAEQLLDGIAAIPPDGGVRAVRVGVGKRDQWIDMHSVRPTKAKVDLLAALRHLRRCAAHPPSDLKLFFAWCREVAKTLERREANTFSEAVAGVEATLFHGFVLYAPGEEEENATWGACNVASAGDRALAAWMGAGDPPRFCLYDDCEDFASAHATSGALVAAQGTIAFAERVSHLLSPMARAHSNGLRFEGFKKPLSLRKKKKKGTAKRKRGGANAHMREGA